MTGLIEKVLEKDLIFQVEEHLSSETRQMLEDGNKIYLKLKIEPNMEDV